MIKEKPNPNIVTNKQKTKKLLPIKSFRLNKISMLIKKVQYENNKAAKLYGFKIYS